MPPKPRRKRFTRAPKCQVSGGPCGKPRRKATTAEAHALVEAVLDKRHTQALDPTKLKKKVGRNRHLGYGEVSVHFAGWLATHLAGLGDHPSFLDVGSGLGRLVWQVAFLCPQATIVRGIIRRGDAGPRPSL